MNLPTIAHDKALHVAYGAAIASLGTLILSWQVGAISCAAVAVGWEALQRLRSSGHPSVQDAIATVCGGAIVVLPWVF
jgi:hypothetical protein